MKPTLLATLREAKRMELMLLNSAMQSTSSPTVGRDPEIQRLNAVVDRTVSGDKRGAVIVASPGLGKTMLLRWTAARAHDLGFVCATVRTPSGTPLPPHYPVGELLSSLLDAAQRIGAQPKLLTTLVAEFRESRQAPAVHAITCALEEICRSQHVALLIDDYHWTPLAGSSLLVSALRSMEAPIALVITARPHSTDDASESAVPESTADLWLETIELHPLDEPFVASLASVVLGGPILPTSAELLHQTTGGNPLHVIETIRNGIAEGWLSAVGGHWTIGNGFTPRSVLESVGARVRRLAEPELNVAAVIAVFGRAATVEEIATIARISAPSAVTSLTALAEAGFVASDEVAPEYRLSHPLHRTAFLDAIGPVRRAALHACVLEMIRDRRVSATELAYHATHSHSRPPDLTTLLHTAADEAEGAGSPAQAAAWFERLVEESVGHGPQQRSALAGWARSRAQYDPATSIDLFAQAIAGVEGTERASLLVQRARAYQRLGRLTEALQDLEAALPIAAPQDLFSIEAGIGTVHLLTGQRALAEERIVRLAEQSVGTPNHARALYHLAAARGYAGDLESCVEYSQQSIEESTDPHLARSARNNVIWSLALLGRWDEAEKKLDPAIAELEATDDYGSLFPLLSNAALMYGWKGDTVKALDLAVRSETIAERIGNPTDRLKALECMAVALLEGGDAAGAASVLEELRELLAGDTEAREINYTYLVMGDTHLALGDLDAASDYCERADALLQSDAVIWAEGIARLRAQIRLAAGDLAGAWSVVAPWIDSPGPVAVEHARMLEAGGRARHALGDRADGYALVEQAHELYEGMGASRRAGTTRGWLVLNAARRVGRPRSTLPAGLTEREVQIVGLIVQGRSNREIAASLVLSPATVKTHVERILAKTGAARRAEVGMIAARLGLKLPSHQE